MRIEMKYKESLCPFVQLKKKMSVVGGTNIDY